MLPELPIKSGQDASVDSVLGTGVLRVPLLPGYMNLHPDTNRAGGALEVADVRRGAISFERDEDLIAYRGRILSELARTSMQIDEGKHVEGTEDTNALRNHSCAPNAYVNFDAILLRALRNIAAGEEITLDCTTADGELHEKFTCQCGAPGCYGEVRGFKCLGRKQKLRLRPYLSPCLRRKLDKEV